MEDQGQSRLIEGAFADPYDRYARQQPVVPDNGMTDLVNARFKALEDRLARMEEVLSSRHWRS
jgi:hypothetical protein